MISDEATESEDTGHDVKLLFDISKKNEKPVVSLPNAFNKKKVLMEFDKDNCLFSSHSFT